MRQLSDTDRTPRLGRVFPDSNYTPEELAQRKAESKALMQRCDAIFEGVKSNLIDQFYDWFMVIEPESGDYFIDENEEGAVQKAHEKYPETACVIYCINETGACCRV
ncbi:hypothetical protein NG791_23840 [Laspinema sp. D1]|uniref:hypothetical protein n=1 Tax=Laspinema palackyanum TaxID=3231601 RepID=UPI00347E800A|nr:hypothetical protein [Laspinema sp. D2b]